MQVGTKLSEQLARYLDLSVSEVKLTASNMANIDTPGYQTKGFDFATEMGEALAGIDKGRIAPLHVHEVDGLVRGRMATTCQWIARDCIWRRRN